MGTSALKSAPITNLDATPVVPNTTGEGAPGYVRSAYGQVTAVAADAAGSTYRLVRVPSNAKVQSLQFESQAQGAGKVQLGLYYSSSTVDGTQASLQGTVIDAKFFSDDIDCAAAVLPGEKVFFTGGSNTPDKRNQPLWQAAGLTADPGGFFDVVATVHTTAITTGTGKLGAAVLFVV
jgi:hypothetical protein